MANSQFYEEYPIIPFGKGAMIIAIGLVIFLEVAIFIIFLTDNKFTFVRFIIASFILTGIGYFCYSFIMFFSGTVILTDDSIIVRRGKKSRSIRYQDIVSFNEREFFIPLNLVLKGNSATLRINRRADNFQELFKHLSERVEVIQYAVETQFPFHLKLKRPLLWEILGIAALLTFIMTMIYIAMPEKPSRNPIDDIIGLSLVGLILFLLFMVIFIFEELKVSQPIELILNSEKIQYRKPFKKWMIVPISQLISITISKEFFSVRAEYDGVSTGGKGIRYPIILQLQDQSSLTISERRSWQFGYSPMRLHQIFFKLYPEKVG